MSWQPEPQNPTTSLVGAVNFSRIGWPRLDSGAVGRPRHNTVVSSFRHQEHRDRVRRGGRCRRRRLIGRAYRRLPRRRGFRLARQSASCRRRRDDEHSHGPAEPLPDGTPPLRNPWLATRPRPMPPPGGDVLAARELDVLRRPLARPGLFFPHRRDRQLFEQVVSQRSHPPSDKILEPPLNSIDREHTAVT